MKPLFAVTPIQLLESLCFTKTLFAFDFDGTLAPIAKVPDQAQLGVTTRRLMTELAQYHPVAVISGRSLRDLKSRIGFNPQFLIGNHGLEGLSARSVALAEAQATAQRWKIILEKRLSRTSDLEQVEIEDKHYSIAMHFRNSRAKKIVKEKILEAITALEPAPRCISGKCVITVIPPGAPHKGMALARLMRETGIQSAFYIGDDDSDEDVFSLQDLPIFTVRVGKKASSQAQYFIRGQFEVNRLLRNLVKFQSVNAHFEGRKSGDVSA